MELVLFADPIHGAGVDHIRANHEVILPEQGLAHPRAAQASVLVVRTTQIDDDIMDRLPRLRLIVKHGAGVDNIDMAAATRRKILVANTPGGSNATAVAEGAVAMMLAVLRRIRDMDALVRSGRFDERWRIRLSDLTGAKVGLVGFGNIARAVARICAAGFGAEVAAFDPMVSPDDIKVAGVIPVDLPNLMARDVISIHVPLNVGTRNLIGAPELALMHSGSVIVNTSRGGILDEAALVAALSSGSIGGAGIDVFEQEPPPVDHPLFALPNVVLAPHVAGVTENSMKGMALAVADVIDVVLAGNRPTTAINPEIWE